jgi:hypothetical protein
LKAEKRRWMALGLNYGHCYDRNVTNRKRREEEKASSQNVNSQSCNEKSLGWKGGERIEWSEKSML